MTTLLHLLCLFASVIFGASFTFVFWVFVAASYRSYRDSRFLPLADWNDKVRELNLPKQPETSRD